MHWGWQVKIVIVGGGIIGLSIARELRRASDAEVLVIEAAHPGAEASSAAAGMLAPQFESSNPGPMTNLGLLSRKMWPQWASSIEAEAGFSVEFVACGGIQVATSPAEEKSLEAKVQWQRVQGLRAQWLDRHELRVVEPALSEKNIAGALFPDEQQVDSPRLMEALHVAARRLHVQLRKGTVRRVIVGEKAVSGVDVDGEVVSASHVVVAAGAWSSLLPGCPIAPTQLKPVRGQMIELRCRGAAPFSRLLKSTGGYLVPRTDGRVVVGSTMDMAGFDKRVTAKGALKLLRAALDLVPSLDSAELVRSWSGLRPWTADQLPFLGPSPTPGLFFATGHFRNGILLAPITARLVTQSLLGQTPEVDLTPFGSRDNLSLK